jgi:2-iminobutanoate/2-iminopropanoate deaminase
MRGRRAVVRGLLVVVPVAVCAASAGAQARHVFNPPGAPATLPFSNGLQVGNTLYISGTQGTKSDSIGAETQSCLDNIKKVLDAAGFKPSDVVQVTVYLTDVNDFKNMNAVYRQFFPDPKPTRATVQVAGLVGGAHIEISAVAVKSGGGAGQ